MRESLPPSTSTSEVAELQLRKFQKELSAGTVSLALLAVLGAATDPMYGYQIAKRLEQVGQGVLSGKQSALYPVLRNLESAGLLDSFVEPSMAGPPRRARPLSSSNATPSRCTCALSMRRAASSRRPTSRA